MMKFLLHYQPQVDSTSGEVTGVEALVRWQDPQEGAHLLPVSLSPWQRIPDLLSPSESGYSAPPAHRPGRGRMQELKQVTMAVNISTHQFSQRDFITTVERVLQETDLDPKYLELELTESIIMKDIETTIETLHALKAMGIRLSIDDFGTGYSSLEYLKRMPIGHVEDCPVLCEGYYDRSE